MKQTSEKIKEGKPENAKKVTTISENVSDDHIGNPSQFQEKIDDGVRKSSQPFQKKK